ncbi:uncharacterized protein LOC130657939 isoform X2 [Hydractinia symbiolongicarpus]|uniref:uncharacterized protein LOC130657939 isoform X2 n=1 Tax=Hydractinia symbiolongicarpus TaxID=13093 RepID=UPI0025508A8B|nr:uncharacterized protein LOC130657939 isoform X2 [Hydractinia symbiolongicarpus]
MMDSTEEQNVVWSTLQTIITNVVNNLDSNTAPSKLCTVENKTQTNKCYYDRNENFVLQENNTSNHKKTQKLEQENKTNVKNDVASHPKLKTEVLVSKLDSQKISQSVSRYTMTEAKHLEIAEAAQKTNKNHTKSCVIAVEEICEAIAPELKTIQLISRKKIHQDTISEENRCFSSDMNNCKDSMEKHFDIDDDDDENTLYIADPDDNESHVHNNKTLQESILKPKFESLQNSQPTLQTDDTLNTKTLASTSYSYDILRSTEKSITTPPLTSTTTNPSTSGIDPSILRAEMMKLLPDLLKEMQSQQAVVNSHAEKTNTHQKTIQAIPATQPATQPANTKQKGTIGNEDNADTFNTSQKTNNQIFSLVEKYKEITTTFVKGSQLLPKPVVSSCTIPTDKNLVAPSHFMITPKESVNLQETSKDASNAPSCSVSNTHASNTVTLGASKGTNSVQKTKVNHIRPYVVKAPLQQEYTHPDFKSNSNKFVANQKNPRPVMHPLVRLCEALNAKNVRSTIPLYIVTNQIPKAAFDNNKVSSPYINQNKKASIDNIKNSSPSINHLAKASIDNIKDSSPSITHNAKASIDNIKDSSPGITHNAKASIDNNKVSSNTNQNANNTVTPPTTKKSDKNGQTNQQVNDNARTQKPSVSLKIDKNSNLPTSMIKLGNFVNIPNSKKINSKSQHSSVETRNESKQKPVTAIGKLEIIDITDFAVMRDNISYCRVTWNIHTWEKESDVLNGKYKDLLLSRKIEYQKKFSLNNHTPASVTKDNNFQTVRTTKEKLSMQKPFVEEVLQDPTKLSISSIVKDYMLVEPFPKHLQIPRHCKTLGVPHSTKVKRGNLSSSKQNADAVIQLNRKDVDKCKAASQSDKTEVEPNTDPVTKMVFNVESAAKNVIQANRDFFEIDSSVGYKCTENSNLNSLKEIVSSDGYKCAKAVITEATEKNVEHDTDSVTEMECCINSEKVVSPIVENDVHQSVDPVTKISCSHVNAEEVVPQADIDQKEDSTIETNSSVSNKCEDEVVASVTKKDVKENLNSVVEIDYGDVDKCKHKIINQSNVFKTDEKLDSSKLHHFPEYVHVKPILCGDNKEEKRKVGYKEFDFFGMLSKEKEVTKHTVPGQKKDKCRYCRQRFTSSELLKHDRVYVKLICPQCKMRICNRKKLTKHILQHAKHKKQCPLCCKSFEDIQSYQSHKSTVHTAIEDSSLAKKKLWKCAQCNKAFRKELHLRKHQIRRCLNNINDSKPEKCFVCKKLFSSKQNVEKHIPLHQVSYMECQECKECFDVEEDSASHFCLGVPKVTLISKYDSTIRNLKKKKIRRKRWNALKQSKQSKRSCVQCIRGFKDRESFYEHINLKDCPDLKDSGQCMLCKQFFQSLENLKTHVMTCFKDSLTSLLRPQPRSASQSHADKKRVVVHCSYCKTLFPSNHAFRNHNKIFHPRTVKYSCLKCGFKSLSKSLLKKHLRLKQCPKVSFYQCFVCDQNRVHYAAFGSLSALVGHMEMHRLKKEVKVKREFNEGVILPAKIQNEDGATQMLSLPLEDVRALNGKHALCEVPGFGHYEVNVDGTPPNAFFNAVKLLLCFDCNTPCRNRKHLMVHFRSYHNWRFVQLSICKPCGIAFKDSDSYHKHKKSCSGSVKNVIKRAMEGGSKTIASLEIESKKLLPSKDLSLKVIPKASTSSELPAMEEESTPKSTCKCSKCGKKKMEAVVCDVCSHSFPCLHQLRVHKRYAHPPPSIYLCRPCEKCFCTAEEFNRHAQLEECRSKKKVVNITKPCYICKKQIRHVKSHVEGHVDVIYECYRCNSKLSSREQLKKHLSQSHMLPWLPADESWVDCVFQAKFATILKNVYLTQEERQPIGDATSKNLKCATCNLVFFYNETLAYHQTVCKPDSPYKIYVCKAPAVNKPSGGVLVDKSFILCTICCRLFDCQETCLLHVAIFHNIKVKELQTKYIKKTKFDQHLQTCSICNAHYTNEIALWRHSFHHAGVAVETCYVCDQSFSTATELKVHTYLAHSGFYCELCYKVFHSLDAFTEHSQLHVIEANVPRDNNGKMVIEIEQNKLSSLEHQSLFPEEETGPKKFVITSKIPKEILGDSRLFYCYVCKQNIEGDLTFIVHMKTHAEPRLLLCLLCKRKFANAEQLCEHIKKHFVHEKMNVRIDSDEVLSDEEELDKCSLCCQVFETSKELTEHKKNNKTDTSVGFFLAADWIGAYVTKYCTLKNSGEKSKEDEWGSDWKIAKEYDLKKILSGINVKNNISHPEVATKVPQDPAICLHCLVSVPANYEKYHIRKHLQSLTKHGVRCLLCTEVVNVDALPDHMKSNHSDKLMLDDVICPHCFVLLRKKEGISVHMAKHQQNLSIGSPFIYCAYCNDLLRRDALVLHMTSQWQNENQLVRKANTQLRKSRLDLLAEEQQQRRVLNHICTAEQISVQIVEDKSDTLNLKSDSKKKGSEINEEQKGKGKKNDKGAINDEEQKKKTKKKESKKKEIITSKKIRGSYKMENLDDKEPNVDFVVSEKSYSNNIPQKLAATKAEKEKIDLKKPAKKIKQQTWSIKKVIKTQPVKTAVIGCATEEKKSEKTSTEILDERDKLVSFMMGGLESPFCKMCDWRFNMFGELKIHLQQHFSYGSIIFDEKSRDVACVLCKQLIRKTSMKTHLLLKHSKEVKHLKQLQTKLKKNPKNEVNPLATKVTPAGLELAPSSNAMPYPFTCAVCGRGYFTSGQYLAHFKVAHPWLFNKEKQKLEKEKARKRKLNSLPKEDDAHKKCKIVVPNEPLEIEKEKTNKSVQSLLKNTANASPKRERKIIRPGRPPKAFKKETEVRKMNHNVSQMEDKPTAKPQLETEIVEFQPGEITNNDTESSATQYSKNDPETKVEVAPKKRGRPPKHKPSKNLPEIKPVIDENDGNCEEKKTEIIIQNEAVGSKNNELVCVQTGEAIKSMSQSDTDDEIEEETEEEEIISSSEEEQTTKQNIPQLHSDAMYICSQCSLAFPCQTELASHVTIHEINPEKHFSVPYPYVCVYCGVGFYKKYALRKHLEGKHALLYTFGLEHRDCFVNRALGIEQDYDTSTSVVIKPIDLPKRSRSKFNEVLKGIKKKPRAVKSPKNLNENVVDVRRSSGRKRTVNDNVLNVLQSKKKTPKRDGPVTKLAQIKKTGLKHKRLIKKESLIEKQPVKEDSESEEEFKHVSSESEVDIALANENENESESSDSDHSTTVVKQFLCKHCDMLFVSAAVLKKHVKSHQNSKDVAEKNCLCCTVCEQQLVRHELKWHMHVRHGADKKVTLSKKKTYCSLCNFACKKNMEKHIAKSHPELLKVECRLCDLRFLTRPRCESHFRDTHGKTIDEETLMCFLCNKQFQTLSTLHFHYSIVHMKKREDLYCSLCSKYFHTQTHLDKHEEEFHKNDRFQCGLCLLEFDHVEACEEHVRSHKMATEHECTVCCFYFESKEQFDAHKKTHDTGRFICPVCFARFEVSSDFEAHKSSAHSSREDDRKHSVQRTYQCTSCDKSFFSLSHIQKHMDEVHQSGARASYGDDEVFSDVTGTATELQLPSINKCDVCGETFLRSEIFLEHKKKHVEGVYRH